MSAMPYVVGQWVRGASFYGREREIAEVLDGPRSSIWLLGTRRSGKTSFLRQLEHLAVTAAEPTFFPVVWDFQGAEDGRELHLNFNDALLDAEERLEQIGLELDEIVADDLTASLGRLRRRLRSKSLRLLLLCDEVEELVALSRREPGLTGKLRRALQASEDVRSVLASTVRLWELAGQSVDTSPFLHGFTPPLYLGRLADDAARALIRQSRLPAEQRPRIEQETVEAIRRSCGNQPYLLQILSKRFAETGNVELATEQVSADRMVSHFFAVDFEMLAPPEQAALRCLAARDAADLAEIRTATAGDGSSLSDSLFRLESLGVVRRDGDQRFSIENAFFRRWLQDSELVRDRSAAAVDARRGETTQPPSTTGSLLDDRYELHEQLGEGATGRVFRAHDRMLGTEIAIKLIRPEYAANEDVLQRFRREIVLSRDIGHPNVLRVYHLGECRGERYLTMQWVDGPTLGDLIARAAPFRTELVAAIGAQVAAALEAAHAHQVIHRDIKPHNILMHQRRVPLVTDFGLARSTGEATLTAVGTFLGTPNYVSPEQARLLPADERSDLYSLGVVLFEMATGVLPFRSDRVAEILELQRTGSPPDPASIHPEIDGRLAQIILRCLEKEPAARFADAGELRARLAELAGDGLSASGLVAMVYDELRGMARGFLSRERSDHTLQPTALVHEAYLRLADQSRVDWRGRTHFLAVAARAMRRILVDHARTRTRQKRGGGQRRITFTEGLTPLATAEVDPTQLLAVEEALERLRRESERQADVVELRCFGGLTVEEIAEHLGVSVRTVASDWARARTWLERELGPIGGAR